MPKQIETLLEHLSLTEKILLLGGSRLHSGTHALSDHALPALSFADGQSGVHPPGQTAPAYPASICLAACFDQALAQAVGAALGQDCRSRGVQVLLGPGVNLQRLPLCGRNFEYLGEDPTLCAALAAAFIQGMQAAGTAACIKHFACNNQEFDRHGCSSDLDERTLREVYLRPYEAAVQAGVATVMTAYNPVNGEHAAENRHLIQDILKGEWGFGGLVMSDWTSTYQAVQSANHGLDLEMPTGKHFNAEQLLPALRQGTVSPACIDDKVRRLLQLMQRFDWLDGLETAPPPDNETSAKVALTVARQGQVLLTNDGLLPADPAQLRHVAVFGYQAGHPVIAGGGSAHGRPESSDTLLDAIREQVPETCRVNYHCGPDPRRFQTTYDTATFVHPDGGPGLQLELFNNNACEGEPKLTQRAEHLHARWMDGAAPDPCITAELFSARWRGAIVAEHSGRHLITSSCMDGGYRLYLDGELVVDAWLNENAKPLTTVRELRAGDAVQVLVEYRKVRHWACMRLGWELEPAADPDWQQALTQAAEADLVVVGTGFCPQLESEGFDRDFDLPAESLAMLHEVAQANPRTAVVLYAGAPVNVEPWLDRVGALLMAWYPGMNGASASAEILFGRQNPAGRLPMIWGKRLQDYGAAKCYAPSGIHRRVHYADGLFIGHRHFDRADIPARFPFGFGLSYTSFELTADNGAAIDANDIQIRAQLRNTGARAGTETVLLFIAPPSDGPVRPLKELADWRRWHLEPGQDTTVHFHITPDMLRCWDIDADCWQVPHGRYTAIIARHSEDPGLRIPFEV
jgi:beta-glucosidase